LPDGLLHGTVYLCSELGYHRAFIAIAFLVENIVTIRALSKIYRQGDINVTALDNISLDIKAGEFLTLMGPSGSGKSTLLHIIAGIDRPTMAVARFKALKSPSSMNRNLPTGETRMSASFFRRSI
jgi:ABC-type dipeptide/oligopeptide/nickel transport system ATPase subunit